MSNAASRNRKRDNAERLGTVQVRVTEWLQETWGRLDWWFDTRAGQFTLLGIAGILGLLASLITP